jgi:hypothetical protein
MPQVWPTSCRRSLLRLQASGVLLDTVSEGALAISQKARMYINEGQRQAPLSILFQTTQGNNATALFSMQGTLLIESMSKNAFPSSQDNM